MNPTPTVEPHWISRVAFPVIAALFFIAQVSLGFAVYRGNYWFAKCVGPTQPCTRSGVPA